MIKDRVIVLLTFFLLVPFISLAQENNTLSVEDIVGSTNFIVNPSSPMPGQIVRVTIQGSGIDLETALLTWSINGQRIKSGYGEKEITFTAGPIGSNSTIKLSIDAEGKTYNRTVTISPGEIDMLWQGNSYTPPFYRGRSLWPLQGDIIVTAIPHAAGPNGIEYNPKTLIYKWYLNDVAYADKSGYGKNTYSFTEPGLALEQNIGVEVYNGETLMGRRYLSLSAINPVTLVYENNPLFGFMFNQEVGNDYHLNKSEISLGAFPYYFSAASKDNPFLSYKWRSGQSGSSQNNSQITYRVPSSSQGKSLVAIDVEHLQKFSQSANKDFLVQFDNDNQF